MGEAFDDIIAAARRDLTAAAGGLMAASEAGLRAVAMARDGDGEALARIEAAFLAVLEACAFEDLIGQRLTRLAMVASERSAPQDALLNGPALPGQGLDQAEIDAWLSADET